MHACVAGFGLLIASPGQGGPNRAGRNTLDRLHCFFPGRLPGGAFCAAVGTRVGLDSGRSRFLVWRGLRHHCSEPDLGPDEEGL